MSHPSNAPPEEKPYRRCSEEGCTNRHLARGMCRKHYLRKWHRQELPQLVKRSGPLVSTFVSLTPNQVVKLRRIARERGVRATEVIRGVLSAFLKAEEAKEREAAAER